MVMELNEDPPVPSVSKKEPEPEKLEENFEVDDDKDLFSTKETQTVKSSRTILQEEDQEDDPRSITASAEETKTNKLEQEQSKPEDGDKEEEEKHLFTSASPEEASTG